jgi:hypothetical protein
MLNDVFAFAGWQLADKAAMVKVPASGRYDAGD